MWCERISGARPGGGAGVNKEFDAPKAFIQSYSRKISSFKSQKNENVKINFTEKRSLERKNIDQWFLGQKLRIRFDC